MVSPRPGREEKTPSRKKKKGEGDDREREGKHACGSDSLAREEGENRLSPLRQGQEGVSVSEGELEKSRAPFIITGRGGKGDLHFHFFLPAEKERKKKTETKGKKKEQAAISQVADGTKPDILPSPSGREKRPTKVKADFSSRWFFAQDWQKKMEQSPSLPLSASRGKKGKGGGTQRRTEGPDITFPALSFRGWKGKGWKRRGARPLYPGPMSPQGEEKERKEKKKVGKRGEIARAQGPAVLSPLLPWSKDGQDRKGSAFPLSRREKGEEKKGERIWIRKGENTGRGRLPFHFFYGSKKSGKWRNGKRHCSGWVL